MIDAVASMQPHAKSKLGYYMGSVPLNIANLWARECGSGIGTREFMDYAKKKIVDPSYSKLSSGLRF